jgi:alpha,alpha-trehalose phosphorylase
MIPRTPEERPEYIYPPEPWRMVERRYYPHDIAKNETLFSVANGFFGIRGTFEEGQPVFQPGTFVNGFFETWPIVHGEDAFGFARTGQTMLNVTDATQIRLHVDDEAFTLPRADLLDYERALDMRSGTLDRTLVWEMASGKRVAISSRRMVSFSQRHLAVIEYTVRLLNEDAPIVIESALVAERGPGAQSEDPRRTRRFSEPVLDPRIHDASGRRLLLVHQTPNSLQTIACGADHEVETDAVANEGVEASPGEATWTLTVGGRKDVPIRIVKYVSYHVSRTASAQELSRRVTRTLDRAMQQRAPHLVEEQRRYLERFWNRADVEIGGDPAAQQAMRFNLFHVLQASGRAEGIGVPAKGLTGQGYEGHYFWDIEIYVFPFLVYTSPRIARNLLKWRYRRLDLARRRAMEVNQRGALYPWRTISGEEASAYYAAGTAQYHINADIVYALKKYVDITGDTEFLYDYGAEIVVETARLWEDLGFYSPSHDGRFCIQGVTGPDEYNTVVDNNAYTNLMAQLNLRYAVDTVTTMKESEGERYTALVHATRLHETELERWRQAADAMFVPYDEEKGIHLQDETFLRREPWDFENTPSDKYPLLLHFHPLVIYRHQVIKQADVVLAMFLLSHEFDGDQVRRNFEFYDPLTTGDSSLSAAIQAVGAAETGDRDKAYRYAMYALHMDLGDLGRNVVDGCHIASMGGTWMVITYGLAGLRDWNGRIGFEPRRPLRFQRIRFPLTIKGSLLRVAMDPRSVRYRLEHGPALTIHHHDEEIALTPERPEAERPYRNHEAD